MTNPPKPPTINETGTLPWIDKRADHLDKKYPAKAPHMRGQQFKSMVGDDPKKPIVNKANLSKAFGVSRGAIYRWLQQYAKDLKRGGNV